MDSGSSVHGILQSRIMEWVAIAFSRGSSQSRDQTQKGKEICSKKSYWTNFINVNNNAYTHTKKAQEVYLKLKEQGYTAQQILNENEQRYNVFKKDIEHLKNREIKFSVADLCVISNTGEIEKFVEIVTENYTEKQIQNKKNYVDHFNADYEIY